MDPPKGPIKGADGHPVALEMETSEAVTFSADLSEELLKLRKRISEHIEVTPMRRALTALGDGSDFSYCDPLLASHLVRILRKMEDREKLIVVNEMVKIVHDSGEIADAEGEPYYIRVEYEQVVDSMLNHAFEEGVLTINQHIEGLVMTTDFSMRSKINRRKWEFVKKCVPKMDYKGIRSLSRYLMDPQFNRLPLTLSLEEVQQLSIIEEILLMIMDRDSNVIPSIFTMTEVNKGVAKQAYIFPRLAHALSQLCIYFRPVADLSHVVGRSFLFPLPQHPCFSSSAPSWRIDGTALHAHIPRFQHQFLPYRTEQSNSQTYLLYMVLRQPRGKDHISAFTHNRSHKFKAPYDVLLSVLICEVMAEAEQLPENEAIPRYQWENILSIIHQGIHLQILNIQHFLSVLRGLVKSANYTRARDEVMWIVLQITGTFSNTPRFEEALNEIIELYKVLFDGEVTWMGASDHIAQFVRFLAAACTWMLLEGKEGLPAPNESIKRQINFIAEGAEKIDSKDDAMLAVLANAYRSDTRVGRSVQIVFQQRLDSIPNDETLFQLSYGRHACNKITSFSSEFLDSLTLRAKGSVLGLCLGSLRNFTSERCPSPAVLDTLAKLISTLEYELGVKPLMNLLQRSLYISNTPNSVETAREQCHILYDFLCYRVPTISLDEVRSEFVIFSLSYLFNLPILQNHQLYCVIEHTVMRNWCWSTYSETIAIGFRHFSKPIQSSSRTTVFLYPGSFPTPSEGKQYPICPEIFRMYLISLMRAIKITGHEVSMDECYFAELVSTLGWPESMKHSFPDWALRSVNTGTNTIVSADLQKAVNTDYNLNLGMGAEHYMNYSQNQNENSPTILAVIFFHIIERRDNTLPLEFYKILQRKSARDIVIATNYLVDYVIAKIKDDLDNNESFSSISKALIEMVFRWHVVSADRLLLALVLHPTNDETSHIAMLLVHDFCTVKDFTDRVEYFHAHLPRKDHHSEYIRKLVDYHTKYPEYTYQECISSYGKPPTIIPQTHMPFYYGSLIDRLLPITDYIICRALELPLVDTACQRLIQSLAPLYKYHPTPLTFTYTVLYYLNDHMKKPLSKTFVLTMRRHVEDMHLTEAFEKYNHQRDSLESLFIELVDRIALSLDFVLSPPPFVAQDWKTAEFSPGAQTIYLACIEIMASPHPPEAIVSAMINMLMVKPQQRPYNVINILALLLTALPDVYGNVLHDEFIAVVDRSLAKNHTFEEIVFDTFEEAQLLHLTSRPLIINALSQAYWTHCKWITLEKFTCDLAPKILDRVQTENDLWYALRLLVPLLQRCYEWPKEKTRHLTESLEVVRTIIDRIAYLTSIGIDIVHSDELCDLLYHFKYVFVGDYLRNNAEATFAGFPKKMRDRLRFYATQSDRKTDEKNGSSHPSVSHQSSFS